jgi:hypothetical protein
LNDRKSINEESAELDVSLTGDLEKPKERLFEIDNSIFEETELSRCAASIEGIAEVDPMGACLLMVLSRRRRPTTRMSIPISQIID